MSYLRTWDCLAYARFPDLERVKLASKAYECVFIWYASNSKAYGCYDLNSKVIIESNDVEFYEDKFHFKSRNSGGTKSNRIHVIRSTKRNNEVETKLC